LDLTCNSTLSTELSTALNADPHSFQHTVESFFTSCGQDLGLYCCNLLVKKSFCVNINYPVIYAKKRQFDRLFPAPGFSTSQRKNVENSGIPIRQIAKK